ncbi:MAG: UDP-2,3-diacylglucosamine diphosphatase [Planctomycetota bacterium]
MKTEFRSVWISDLHLGTRWTNVDALSRFLATLQCENLYLVGDIFDFWAMDAYWYWPKAHNDIMLQFFRKAAEGSNVIYVPGNHDELLRGYDGSVVTGVKLHNSVIHTTADDRRFLVMHGDELDRVVSRHSGIAKLGARADNIIRWINEILNRFLRSFDIPEWDFPAYLKHSVKAVCKLGSSFERSLADLAANAGCAGVICGHVHETALKDLGSALYCNDGDWIDNASALVEHRDGHLELLTF